MKKNGFLFYLFSFLLLSQCTAVEEVSPRYYKIQVVDEKMGEGIPMVELKALNNKSYFSDSQGYIAFREEGLMDRQVYFYISSPGYDYPKDKTGRSSVRLQVKAGESVQIEMKRINPAERLYRITGSGIYEHSQILDLPVPLKQPNLNAGVLGQDSNLSTIYKGSIFWIWGDTFLPGEYQGNFAVSAATTPLPEENPLPHSKGIDYQYFLDEAGNSKPMIDPQGPGYVWFDWLMNIPDSNGIERLVAKFARVNSYFGNYERGIAIFNDEKEIFERYTPVEEWMKDLHTCTHPFLATSKEEPHYYLFSEWGLSRVKPRLEEVSTESSYEYFTCLAKGEQLNKDQILVERDATGQPVYDWKKNTKPINVKNQKQLVDNKSLTASEVLFQTYDMQTGEAIELSRGSIAWNEYRQRWIMINGTKDTYYLEADTPVGPWVYARKVAEHDNAFYNPLHHPFFDEEGGQKIYFEGTYTRFFGQGKTVPLYDYNQIMYRLDLSQDNVQLPVPLYEFTNEESAIDFGFRQHLSQPINKEKIKTIPFFALENKNQQKELIPIYKSNQNGLIRLSRQENGDPLFYAISNDSDINAGLFGTWETKMGIASFNNYCVFEVSKEGEQIRVQSQNPAFTFSNASIENGVLQLELEQEDKTYVLSGKIVNGHLEGSFKNKKTGSGAGWNCKKLEDDWWGQFSPLVLPLYEYRNRQNNRFHYSTNESLSPTLFERSEAPLCRVWKNPHSLLIGDFEIKAQ